MKIIFGIIMFVLLVIYIEESHAIEITSPKEGEVFYAGSTFDIIVKPGDGEDWAKVFYYVNPMDYNFIYRQYKATLKIPIDLLGNQELSISAVDQSGNAVELRGSIFIKLPPNVVLKGIVAGDAGDDLISLKKMPVGSAAIDIERYGTRQLTTHGQYSDNVNREMTSATSGTTYTSSNENIATVSPDGKVSAQGLGTATITVINGKYSATVKVVVKPYKQ